MIKRGEARIRQREKEVERLADYYLTEYKKCRIKRQGHTEDDLQISCVRWFEYQYPQVSMLLHHSPNGGARNIITGARFKKMGTRAGFPDLFLCIARRGFHGLFIEMKTMNKNSRQSEHQKEMEKLLEGQGYKYFVCRSLEMFQKIIIWYLK